MLNYDIEICAKQHVNRHVVSQIKEYSQILSTAHRFLDGKKVVGRSISGRKKIVYQLDDNRDDQLYSATHINHPSTVWTRESAENYNWLLNLTIELAKEYTYRYNKIHKAEHSGLLYDLRFSPNNIQRVSMTKLRLAMPDEFKHDDSVIAYRNYYNGAKRRLFDWKNREIPDWII